MEKGSSISHQANKMIGKVNWYNSILASSILIALLCYGAVSYPQAVHASNYQHPVSTGTIPPWSSLGTVLASVDGISVYSNGGKVNNGQQSTYGYKYQCVELIQRYFAVRWGYQNIWSNVTYAFQMMENRPNYDRSKNYRPINAIWNPASPTAPSQPTPKKGDALVFAQASNGSNQAGHVALVTDVFGGNVYFVEQNYSRYGQGFLPIASNGYISPRDGLYAVRGWLHSTSNQTNYSPTFLGFEVALPGISNVGQDNNNPHYPKRTLTVTISDTNNRVTTLTGNVIYNSSNGVFAGIVDLGTAWSSGMYSVRVRLPYTLGKPIPGLYFNYTYNVVSKGIGSYLYVGTADASTSRRGLSLVSGDLNNDNQLDTLDYNILQSCYGSKQCPPNQKVASDLNDNGVVDSVDYNIWLRNFQSPQRG